MVVLGVCLRRLFAAALMFVLSASLLLVGGTPAVNYHIKNGATGQANLYPINSIPVHIDVPSLNPIPVGNTTLIIPPTTLIIPPDDVSNCTGSTLKNTQGTGVGEPSAGPAKSETALTKVLVLPSKVVVSANQTFSVDVWISNVTDMAGWEITLTWNSSVLRCIKAQVNTPPEWGGLALDLYNKTASDVDPNTLYNAPQ
jgi:hypothetical protein